MYTILIARLLGVLLLTAAALKAYGAAVEPIARSGIFASPAFQFLVIGFEVALGVWLFSGWQPIGSWLVSLAAFSIFSVITFHQGWIGQASCGCAGRLVSINPWVAFAVDVTIVACLLRFRPDIQSLGQLSRQDLSRALLKIGGIAATYLTLLGLVALFSHYRYGSIDGGLAALRRESVSVIPSTLDVGTGYPGEAREANLELANRTDQPIRFVGGTSDCSCTVIGDLPITIPPGESRSITASIRLPNTPGRFTRLGHLLMGTDGLERVRFRVTGRINSAPSQPEKESASAR